MDIIFKSCESRPAPFLISAQKCIFDSACMENAGVTSSLLRAVVEGCFLWWPRVSGVRFIHEVLLVLVGNEFCLNDILA